jgi:hypothetical protein
MKLKHLLLGLVAALMLVAEAGAVTTVKVLVLWSKHAKANTPLSTVDYATATASLVAEMNDALYASSSSVNTLVSPAGYCIFETDPVLEDSTSLISTVGYTTADREWKWCRDQVGADLTLLALYKPQVTGGDIELGYALTNAPYYQAIAATNVRNIFDYGTSGVADWGQQNVFAHELAHLFGARHQVSGGIGGNDTTFDVMHGHYDIAVATNFPPTSEASCWLNHNPNGFPYIVWYDASKKVCSGDIMTYEPADTACFYYDKRGFFSDSRRTYSRWQSGTWFDGDSQQSWCGHPGASSNVAQGTNSETVMQGLDTNAPSMATYHTFGLWSPWSKKGVMTPFLRMLGLGP